MTDEIELLVYESAEQLKDFAERSTRTGRIVPPDDEIPAYIHYYMLAVSMHRLKMADIIWFDAEVFPHIPDVDIEVVINPDIDPKETNKKTIMYRGMSLTAMVNLTNMVIKPEWAKDENAN